MLFRIFVTYYRNADPPVLPAYNETGDSDDIPHPPEPCQFTRLRLGDQLARLLDRLSVPANLPAQRARLSDGDGRADFPADGRLDHRFSAAGRISDRPDRAAVHDAVRPDGACRDVPAAGGHGLLPCPVLALRGGADGQCRNRHLLPDRLRRLPERYFNARRTGRASSAASGSARTSAGRSARCSERS